MYIQYTCVWIYRLSWWILKHKHSIGVTWIGNVSNIDWRYLVTATSRPAARSPLEPWSTLQLPLSSDHPTGNTLQSLCWTALTKTLHRPLITCPSESLCVLFIMTESWVCYNKGNKLRKNNIYLSPADDLGVKPNLLLEIRRGKYLLTM